MMETSVSIINYRVFGNSLCEFSMFALPNPVFNANVSMHRLRAAMPCRSRRKNKVRAKRVKKKIRYRGCKTERLPGHLQERL